MCLGHVYIVLEPVGSARLKFCDDRYYEFLCFDVPKVVRSPGCDHRHDEESRNGRDINIDILKAYIWISEVFRVKSEKTRVPEGLREPPGKVLGLSEPEGRERAAAQEVVRPLPRGVRIELGEGGAAALATPPLLPLRPIRPNILPGVFR